MLKKGNLQRGCWGLFSPNNSFVWTTFSKPAGTARPFQTRALEQRVLFLVPSSTDPSVEAH